MMRTDGTPLTAEGAPGTRTVQVGDVHHNPDTQAPEAPPSLRKPGETLPADDGKNGRIGVMKPVQFPKQEPDDEPNAHPDQQPATPQTSPASTPSTQPAAGTGQSPAPAQPAPSQVPAPGQQPQ